MRFFCVMMIAMAASLAFIAGCEPGPEIFAMKKERINETTKKTTFYTNGMLSSESISTKNNGIDDIWRFYDEQGRLVRIDEDLNFDGVVDKIRVYEPETGLLMVTRIDANFDGTFEVVDEYQVTVNKSDEMVAREEENQEVDVDEMVTVAPPQQPVTVYRETENVTTVETVNTTDELIEIPPSQAPARTSSIIIEEDYPRTQPGSGSYFEPLEVNPGTGTVTPARNSKIVPAPVFTHPSDNLED